MYLKFFLRFPKTDEETCDKASGRDNKNASSVVLLSMLFFLFVLLSVCCCFFFQIAYTCGQEICKT